MQLAASTRPQKIYLIAAEESGDRLGAALMEGLRARLGPNVEFSGIGGHAMTAQGLTSLFPIEELSIIGFVAVLQRLPMLLRRINEATEAVLKACPDMLVIIDSPDFTHRVAKRVRARDPSIPIIDYVSPTVWVWRQGRAKKMRAYVDHLLALLPFEPEVHRKLGGPPCTYVGHPLMGHLDTLRPDASERQRRLSSPPVLLVLPGSRASEIRRHMIPFGETLALLQSQNISFELVLPTVPHLIESVRSAVKTWPVQPRILVDDDEKNRAFRNARAALAKSGTVTLQLALSGVPMVTAYKVSAIEAFIARRVLKTPSVILANLVLGENVVPEFIQDDFTPENLAAALRSVLKDTPQRQRQLDAFARLEDIMSTGGRLPSELAVDQVVAALERSVSQLSG